MTSRPNPTFLAWVDEEIDAALESGRITPISAPRWRAKLVDDPGPTIVTMRGLAASESVARANKQKAPTSP